MAETIKNQWLINSNNEKIAPYTMLNQVLDSKTGKSLDILLDNLKNSNGQINFQNTYFLSQEMENKESEASALKRLLALNGFKVIIIDRNVTLDGKSLTILSNTFLIGAHKNITIQNNTTNNAIFVFSLEDSTLSNVYIANLVLKSYSISFGSNNNKINCQNCKFENILVQSKSGSNCYANNLILNSISFLAPNGYFTLAGENLNLQNIQFTSVAGVSLTLDNSLVDNIIISEASSFAQIMGDNNTFQNLIFKNNTFTPTLSGQNNSIQGKCLGQKANGKATTSEFALRSNSLNNIITMQLIPSPEDPHSYGIDAKGEINNQFYISSPEGAYYNGDNLFKDMWVFSDYQTAMPLRVNLEELSENSTGTIQELSAGQYFLNGTFNDEFLSLSSFVSRPADGTEVWLYPISLKNMLPLRANEIYISVSASGVEGDSFNILPNEKVSAISLTQYPNIGLYLNGEFDNEIFSLQQIFSTKNNKVHIGG